jgi:hypothetical protein
LIINQFDGRFCAVALLGPSALSYFALPSGHSGHRSRRSRRTLYEHTVAKSLSTGPQSVVDDKHMLIVESKVENRSDADHLHEMSKAAKDALDARSNGRTNKAETNMLRI